MSGPAFKAHSETHQCQPGSGIHTNLCKERRRRGEAGSPGPQAVAASAQSDGCLHSALREVPSPLTPRAAPARLPARPRGSAHPGPEGAHPVGEPGLTLEGEEQGLRADRGGGTGRFVWLSEQKEDQEAAFSSRPVGPCQRPGVFITGLGPGEAATPHYGRPAC